MWAKNPVPRAWKDKTGKWGPGSNHLQTGYGFDIRKKQALDREKLKRKQAKALRKKKRQQMKAKKMAQEMQSMNMAGKNAVVPM